jgi:hypothetical protein
MKLYFKMSELIYSDTAIKHNINNMPDINALDCLLYLIVCVLQPLREKLGKPIKITSGYRCPQVNELVGGAKDSQHPKGQAGDITALGMSAKELYEFIKNSGIKYDQLILEPSWVHVSYNHGKNRMQNLIKR